MDANGILTHDLLAALVLLRGALAARTPGNRFLNTKDQVRARATAHCQAFRNLLASDPEVEDPPPLSPPRPSQGTHFLAILLMRASLSAAS